MTLAVKVALNPNTTNQPTFPNNKFSDWSKFKAFADNKMNASEHQKFFLGWIENIVEKGENAGYQHYSFSHNVSKGFFLTLSHTSPVFYLSALQVILKTLWEKEKLLVTSNFSISHSVFNSFGEHFCQFHQI